ncbi:MAG: Fic family protein [Deferribacterales bacterium]
MIKKVITDTYEDVHFSDKYDAYAVGVMLRELDVRSAHFARLPLAADVRDFLKGELITNSLYSTASIGRPDIDEEDARAYLSGKKDALDETQAKFLVNIKRAEEYIDKTYKTFELTPENLRKLHMIYIMDTSEGLPGVFRTGQKQELSKDYTPPKSSLEELTGDFCRWFNSGEMLDKHPLVRAFLAHYHIGMLQPFTNANGRVARAVEAIILKQSGHLYLHHSLAQYYRRNRKDYIKAFIKNEKTGGFDMTPFLLFCLDGASRSYKMLTDTAVSGLRLIGVRDHIRMLRLKRSITERQQTLLDILFRYDKPFCLTDLLANPIFSGLYRGMTENTARNDIKRLKELSMITSDDGKLYSFNRFVIG